jgi:hypothetical protein
MDTKEVLRAQRFSSKMARRAPSDHRKGLIGYGGLGVVC